MTDLPTREQANGVLLLREVSRGERALAMPVIRAYAAGVLMTREEFVESLDMEAAASIEHDQWMRWVQAIIDTEPGLSPERVARWREYMVPYGMLDAEVKEADRVEARRWIAAALGEDTE